MPGKPLLAVMVLFLAGACQAPPTGTADGAGGIDLLQRETAARKQQAARPERRMAATAGRHAPWRRPGLPRSIRFDGNPALGSKKAGFAMIEFSDFQCPFCRRYNTSTFKRIRQRYVDSGRLYYVYRDLPLGKHRLAPRAAVAANCAGQQGAYWAMQGVLFSRSARLRRDFYLQTAKRLELDTGRFASCLGDEKQLQEVMRDARYGLTLGIRGTPVFFIGRIDGEKIVDVRTIVGAQPFESFTRVIDQVLSQGQ